MKGLTLNVCLFAVSLLTATAGTFTFSFCQQFCFLTSWVVTTNLKLILAIEFTVPYHVWWPRSPNPKFASHSHPEITGMIDWAIGGTPDKSMTERFGYTTTKRSLRRHASLRRHPQYLHVPTMLSLRFRFTLYIVPSLYTGYRIHPLSSGNKLSRTIAPQADDSISWNFISATLSTRLRHHQLSDLAKHYQKNHPR